MRRGRREEFEEFEWKGEAPDPHDEVTFQRSKLTWNEDREMRDLYRDLLRMRSSLPSRTAPSRQGIAFVESRGYSRSGRRRLYG